MKVSIACLLLVLALISGCATLFGQSDQTFVVTSVPPGAQVAVTDQGRPVFAGTTPTTVTLPKSDGHYFGAQDYVFVFSKPTYCPQSRIIKPGVSGWYFGNILLGGIIGMLIVDPWNGGMYTYKTSVNGVLAGGCGSAQTKP